MRRFLSYPHLVSTLALVVALSGGAYAAGLVGTSDLKDGAVTTAKIDKHAVTEGRLAKKLAKAVDRASGPPRAFHFRHDQIIQVGSVNAPVGTFALPREGDYMVTGVVRAFSRASNPGHNLNCFFNTGAGPSINNAWVDELRYLPLTGVLTTTMPNQSVDLDCQQIQGTGEITISYDLTMVSVDTGS